MKAATTKPEEGKERLRMWHVESDEKDKNCGIIFILTQRYAGQNTHGIHFPLERLSYESKMKAATTRPEEGKERLRMWNVESDEKDKKQVTIFLESMYNANQRKLLPLGYKLCFIFDVKESIGVHGRDKAQKLFNQQADFIKIHRSVRVPGVKGAYYEDKTAGCSLADCIMSLKSKIEGNIQATLS
jgi:hypothetical protein